MDGKGLTALDHAYKRGPKAVGFAGDLLAPLTRNADYVRRSSNKDIQGKKLRRLAELGDVVRLANMFDGERKRAKAGKILDEFASDFDELPLSHRQDQHGTTALMEAARHGHAACVDVLLQHGADPLARDSRGDSALMLAAAGGHLECARLLLPRSHVDAKNRFGETALKLADASQHRHVFDELAKVARLDLLNES